MLRLLSPSAFSQPWLTLMSYHYSSINWITLEFTKFLSIHFNKFYAWLSSTPLFNSDLDPLPISQDEDVNVGRGGGVKISLPPFKSYPFPPTVEWRLNSNIMADEGQNHQVTLSKDLVLLDSQNIDDGKQFQADILNGLNGQTSTTQTYTVRVSGVFLLPFVL